MAKIDVRINTNDDITVFTAEGLLSAEEIEEFSTQYYTKIPTKNVLWDARNATVVEISPDEFRKIAKIMKESTLHRKFGKTAFVNDNNEDYDMGKLYEGLAIVEKLPVRYRVFRNMADAENWLSQK